MGAAPRILKRFLHDNFRLGPLVLDLGYIEPPSPNERYHFSRGRWRNSHNARVVRYRLIDNRSAAYDSDSNPMPVFRYKLGLKSYPEPIERRIRESFLGIACAKYPGGRLNRGLLKFSADALKMSYRQAMAAAACAPCIIDYRKLHRKN